jgi:decaprenyl-phosphate phosphoribosyltransferase
MTAAIDLRTTTLDTAGIDPAGPARRRSDHRDRPSASTIQAFLRAIRPHQWVKNVLIIGAPAAAGTLLAGPTLLRLSLAFAALCAAASATYLVNDIGDIERDRRHPTKRFRPIASGALSITAARRGAVILAAVGLAIGSAISITTGATIALYLALTLAYSRRLNHVAWVELGVVALGFVLRVVAGAAATSTALSLPFLTVVAGGSLFLVAGKRLSELIELGDAASDHRPVLGRYRRSDLERTLGAATAVMLIAYALWAIRADLGGDGVPWLAASIIPVVAATAHVGRLILRGRGGDPTALVLHDRLLQAAALVAGLVVFAGLYVA